MSNLTNNQKAFLDTIAYSELGLPLIRVSDNGYNVIVGSTAKNPILFNSYNDHPRKLVQLRPGLASTAAGRYQLLAKYFDAYKKLLNLKDFSKASQDIIAIQQIKERNALSLIESGKFEDAVTKVSNIWASLPGAGYGQHENSMQYLKLYYKSVGGVCN